VGGFFKYYGQCAIQLIFEKGHGRNKCSIDSSASQKQHFLHPFHCLLIRLSLIRKTYLLRNHMKIFILSGILSFHKYFEEKWSWEFIKSSYIDLTINNLDDVSFQTNLSGSLFRIICIIRLHKCNHVFHLVPSSSLQNHTFKGTFERPEYTIQLYVQQSYIMKDID
jgi:hypothetical protein